MAGIILPFAPELPVYPWSFGDDERTEQRKEEVKARPHPGLCSWTVVPQPLSRVHSGVSGEKAAASTPLNSRMCQASAADPTARCSPGSQVALGKPGPRAAVSTVRSSGLEEAPGAQGLELNGPFLLHNKCSPCL